MRKTGYRGKRTTWRVWAVMLILALLMPHTALTSLAQEDTAPGDGATVAESAVEEVTTPVESDTDSIDGDVVTEPQEVPAAKESEEGTLAQEEEIVTTDETGSVTEEEIVTEEESEPVTEDARNDAAIIPAGTKTRIYIKGDGRFTETAKENTAAYHPAGVNSYGYVDSAFYEYQSTDALTLDALETEILKLVEGAEGTTYCGLFTPDGEPLDPATLASDTYVHVYYSSGYTDPQITPLDGSISTRAGTKMKQQAAGSI